MLCFIPNGNSVFPSCCNTARVPPEGILYGTMTLELGGKVTIECEKTKCFTELEFKLKVHFSTSNSNNISKLTSASVFVVVVVVVVYCDGCLISGN